MAKWQSVVRGAVLGLLVGSAALAQDAPAASGEPEPQLAWLGTGGVTGVYFPVGIAVCRLVNQHRRETGVRCAAKQTAGSVENASGLRDGTLQFAMVQSDVQAAAVAGSGAFAGKGPDTGLRAVMSLYPEALTLVVRTDAGVRGVEDLAGKRVALGQAGSGTRVLADAVLAALGWSAASFAATPEIPPENLPRALCSGEVDGFVYAVGNPARVIQEATTSCDARLVSIAGPAIDALIASKRYFVAATIPGGLYRGTAAPIETIGVGATLLTEADVPDATVALLVSSVFDDLDTLRGLDPVLTGVEPEAMTTEGLTAPLHPAAERYYREHGWLH